VTDPAPDFDPSAPDSPPLKNVSRPRRLLLSNLQIILLALLVVGGRLLIDFSQRILEGQRKVAERQALEAEIERLLAERQALEADKARYGSESYIETWAHDEGKMVRPGERLVVPIYQDAPQTAADAPSTQNTPSETIPAWRVWWLLFFDGPPPLAAETP
jgi:cell division protein FtsB